MNFIKARGKSLMCGDEPVLLRGFGLGGWFLPEGYMWKLYKKCDRPRRMEAMIEKLCGKEYASRFWKKYVDYYITEDDIELIAKEGFNSIRLPLNSRHLYRYRDGEFQFVPETIGKIDELLQWCKKRKIYVILDMHGAPGGQTGQNIDDSENDAPLLFMNEEYEEELLCLWRELALRYRDEEIIAGYDLLNEPLPEWFSKWNYKVLPLYQKLIREIREVDKNHMIILEGVHWATDFSIFDELSTDRLADNIMLQFHKYWSNPDKESMETYLNYQERFQIPLFMGEGGENNPEWYTMLFPLYEKLNISWSFWTYKKMDCTNSPVTFNMPEGWEDIIDSIDGKGKLKEKEAIKIFDDFLRCIAAPGINKEVLLALKRQVPVTIPCEGYDDCQILSERKKGASLRKKEPVSLLFENGRQGEVDYKRYGGEPQPESENIVVSLAKGDSVDYRFIHDQSELLAEVLAGGKGILRIILNDSHYDYKVTKKQMLEIRFHCIPSVNQIITLKCEEGSILLDTLRLE